jgi:hypothetical protein
MHFTSRYGNIGSNRTHDNIRDGAEYEYSCLLSGIHGQVPISLTALKRKRNSLPIIQRKMVITLYGYMRTKVYPVRKLKTVRNFKN